MTPRIVEGDLLEQQAEAIVNAWNRNIIPWWLLWAQGVSGAIKKRHGFRSVAFPIIGAGSGGFDEARALEVMVSTLEARDAELDVTVVRYRRR